MYWFKHHVDLSRQESVTPFLEAAKDRFAAFGFLCALLEVVAEHWDGEGEPAVTHGLQTWARVLGCHQNRVRVYLGTPESGVGQLGDCPLIEVTYEGDRCKIHIESIRTWQDEYTLKKGRTLRATQLGNSGVTPARTEEDNNRSSQISSRRSAPATTHDAHQLNDHEIEERVSTVIVDWNDMAEKAGLQVVDYERLPDSTLDCARTRVVDEGWFGLYKEAIERIPQIPFLLHGDPNSEKFRGVKSKFAFFVRPETVQKILSGEYGETILKGLSFYDKIDF